MWEADRELNEVVALGGGVRKKDVNSVLIVAAFGRLLEKSGELREDLASWNAEIMEELWESHSAGREGMPPSTHIRSGQEGKHGKGRASQSVTQGTEQTKN